MSGAQRAECIGRIVGYSAVLSGASATRPQADHAVSTGSNSPLSSPSPNDLRAARDRVVAAPHLPLTPYPTPIEELPRLRALLGMSARLFVKRDDALSFGGGGNKVRKLEMLVARALAEGADALVTMGGLQSNHIRVTAAVAAKLGMPCVLVVNGEPQTRLTGNALLVDLLGAQVEYVGSRAERGPRMERVLDRMRQAHRRPFAIPLGGSTAVGALGYVRAVEELLTQMEPPDVIVHAASSGGTQAGLTAGCALHGLHTRVMGISADESAVELARTVRRILEGMSTVVGIDAASLAPHGVETDDRFIGGGYAIPSTRSKDAVTVAARTEGLLLDPVYTAKAMAGLMAYAREGRFDHARSVLFWHTGGIPGLFA
jgi:D-cysteine desulfhydrase family pyridoxal phosphate-dependent enzyme